MIFALVFSFGGISYAQEVPQDENGLTQGPPPPQNDNQDLQRIPSPDQIKNFQNIKKVGNALMGKPKDQRGSNPGKPKGEKPANASSTKPRGEKPPKGVGTSTLEKISHPNEIKNFEKVQKIGSTLYGVRKGGAQKPPVYVTPEALACVKAAIDKKDLAEKSVVTSRGEKVFAAIDARNTCQKAALDKTTAKEQGAANKICAESFKSSMEEINTSMEATKTSNWTTYNADLKSCSALQTTTTTSANTIAIEDGGSTTDSPAQ